MTHRSHLVDMPTHLGLAYVPLDGIGCTFTLIKAHVHREGVMFPTYVFENQVWLPILFISKKPMSDALD